MLFPAQSQYRTGSLSGSTLLPTLAYYDQVRNFSDRRSLLKSCAYQQHIISIEKAGSRVFSRESRNGLSIDCHCSWFLLECTYLFCAQMCHISVPCFKRFKFNSTEILSSFQCLLNFEMVPLELGKLTDSGKHSLGGFVLFLPTEPQVNFFNIEHELPRDALIENFRHRARLSFMGTLGALCANQRDSVTAGSSFKQTCRS